MARPKPFKFNEPICDPQFSMLGVMVLGMGASPVELIIDFATYQMDLLRYRSDFEFDLESIRQKYKVVFNLAADADMGRLLLPTYTEFLDEIGLPVINHPKDILRTSRGASMELLSGLPNCRCPETTLVTAGEVLPVTKFPILIRPAGGQAGMNFEKAESLEELSHFRTKNADKDHYLIEYIDYRSSDGCFRKYRIMFVDGKIIPYHLCIGEEWKLHHLKTDMIHQAWKQEEEHHFLMNPQAVFNAKNFETLQKIQEIIGLDYFGVDCGLDRNGNLVVFETNACMWVHLEEEPYLYKNPYSQRIQVAFDEMVTKRAR